MSSGGGANPLGGGGTPFTPVALVKFGKAITWKKTAGSASHDADKTASLSTGTRPTATVDIPVGTTDVFVQIGNIGDTDGAYDDITVDLAPATVDPPVTGDPPVTPPTDSPAQTESVTACGCSTPGHTSSLPLAGLFAGLALAGGVVRRRRR
jgi:MYXO-CTERM domain-containing protein